MGQGINLLYDFTIQFLKGPTNQFEPKCSSRINLVAVRNTFGVKFE